MELVYNCLSPVRAILRQIPVFNEIVHQQTFSYLKMRSAAALLRVVSEKGRMAADGNRNSEAVQSSFVTHQVQRGNGPVSRGDMYAAALSSFAKAQSPAVWGRTLVSLSRRTAKRRSQSVDCSSSLRSRICKMEEIIEEGSSSATQSDWKYELLPTLTSAKRLCVLSENLAAMRGGFHQDADHSAITPFKRIDLMLLTNDHRGEGKNGCIDDRGVSSAKVIKCGSSDYQDRRRKNNDAARRSREARRTKEAVNRTRMVHLEEENSQLRLQIDNLRRQLNHMQLMLIAGKATFHLP
uniref:BZIP domain-containing protein n=2 Tax=Parascaris univalens TaxID=6257 RepID=A0A915C618_PARUN